MLDRKEPDTTLHLHYTALRPLHLGLGLDRPTLSFSATFRMVLRYQLTSGYYWMSIVKKSWPTTQYHGTMKGDVNVFLAVCLSVSKFRNRPRVMPTFNRVDKPYE